MKNNGNSDAGCIDVGTLAVATPNDAAFHCLIAASHDIFVNLRNPVRTDFGGFVSVDSVIFHGRFKGIESGKRCLELLDTVPTEKPPKSFESRNPNRWRYLRTFEVGKSSVTVGIGWNQNSGKVDMASFKVDYNPNKVGDNVLLDKILKKVSRFAKSVELNRFDMAIDIPMRCCDCLLVKDRKNYTYIRGRSGKTEYLGSRSKPGYVKLYDKTAELSEVQGIDVDSPWTRLEITCDGSWDVGKIRDNIPRVITYKDASGEDMTPMFRAVLKSVSLLVQSGQPVDSILAELDYRTERRVVDFLEAPDLHVSDEYLQHAIDSAKGELNRFTL